MLWTWRALVHVSRCTCKPALLLEPCSTRSTATHSPQCSCKRKRQPCYHDMVCKCHATSELGPAAVPLSLHSRSGVYHHSAGGRALSAAAACLSAPLVLLELSGLPSLMKRWHRTYLCWPAGASCPSMTTSSRAVLRCWRVSAQALCGTIAAMVRLQEAPPVSLDVS